MYRLYRMGADFKHLWGAYGSQRLWDMLAAMLAHSSYNLAHCRFMENLHASLLSSAQHPEISAQPSCKRQKSQLHWCRF